MEFRNTVIKKVILLSLILSFGCAGIFGIIGDGNAQISCDTGPTPNFPTGCDLLLNYDWREGTEGDIDAGEVQTALIDQENGIITMDERNYILTASISDGINGLCDGCFTCENVCAVAGFSYSSCTISDVSLFQGNCVLTMGENYCRYGGVEKVGTPCANNCICYEEEICPSCSPADNSNCDSSTGCNNVIPPPCQCNYTSWVNDGECEEGGCGEDEIPQVRTESPVDCGAGDCGELSRCYGMAECILNLPDKSISDIIEDLINWILTIAVVVAIIMLIVGGILYIMAAGDETRILLAKKIVTYAILGLLVIGLSYIIVKQTADIIEGIA